MSKIIQEITPDGLHVPRALMDQMGWSEGKTVVLEAHEQTVLISPEALTAADMSSIALGFLLEEVGDAAAINTPQEVDGKWVVDVVLPHSGKSLGRLVFTDGGELVPERSDSPTTLVKRADEA